MKKFLLLICFVSVSAFSVSANEYAEKNKILNKILTTIDEKKN
jgi:hypothetical protein